MRSQEEGVQWKEEYEQCAEKLKQLEILSKDGKLSSKNQPPHDKTNKMACASSEDPDQPGHPPSLGIRPV